jgi:uncharacterized protein (TIGR02246 family)
MTETKTTNKLTLIIIGSVVSLIFGFVLGIMYNDSKSKTNGVMLSSGPELEKIQTVTNEFVEAWIKGDAEGCANTYSMDAVFMTPDQPSFHGRQAIMERYDKMFKSRSDSVTIQMTETVHNVIYFDDWAVMRGSGYETRMGIETKETYKWIILAKRQPSGKWETVWDIFNDVESL